MDLKSFTVGGVVIQQSSFNVFSQRNVPCLFAGCSRRALLADRCFHHFHIHFESELSVPKRPFFILSLTELRHNARHHRVLEEFMAHRLCDQWLHFLDAVQKFQASVEKGRPVHMLQREAGDIINDFIAKHAPHSVDPPEHLQVSFQVALEDILGAQAKAQNANLFSSLYSVIEKRIESDILPAFYEDVVYQLMIGASPADDDDEKETEQSQADDDAAPPPPPLPTPPASMSQSFSHFPPPPPEPDTAPKSRPSIEQHLAQRAATDADHPHQQAQGLTPLTSQECQFLYSLMQGLEEEVLVASFVKILVEKAAAAAPGLGRASTTSTSSQSVADTDSDEDVPPPPTQHHTHPPPRALPRTHRQRRLFPHKRQKSRARLAALTRSLSHPALMEQEKPRSALLLVGPTRLVVVERKAGLQVVTLNFLHTQASEMIYTTDTDVMEDLARRTTVGSAGGSSRGGRGVGRRGSSKQKGGTRRRKAKTVGIEPDSLLISFPKMRVTFWHPHVACIMATLLRAYRDVTSGWPTARLSRFEVSYTAIMMLPLAKGVKEWLVPLLQSGRRLSIPLQLGNSTVFDIQQTVSELKAKAQQYRDAKARAKVIGSTDGAWKADTAGGCTNFSSWRENDQFIFKLHSPPKDKAVVAVFTLSQKLEAAPNIGKAPRYTGIGLYVLQLHQKKQAQRMLAIADGDIMRAPQFAVMPSISVTLTFAPGSDALENGVLLLPCTFYPEPGVHRSFSLSVTHTHVAYEAPSPVPTPRPVGLASRSAHTTSSAQTNTMSSKGTMSYHKKSMEEVVAELRHKSLFISASSASALWTGDDSDDSADDDDSDSEEEDEEEKKRKDRKDKARGHSWCELTPKECSCRCSFEVLPPLNPEAVSTVSGRWELDPFTAGGAFPLHSSWLHNPQYALSVPASAYPNGLLVALSQTTTHDLAKPSDSSPSPSSPSTPSAVRRAAELQAIGFLVLRRRKTALHGAKGSTAEADVEAFERTMCIAQPDVFEASRISRSLEVTCTLDMSKGNASDSDLELVIIPFTLFPEVESAFQLSVFSLDNAASPDVPLALRPLPHLHELQVQPALQITAAPLTVSSSSSSSSLLSVAEHPAKVDEISAALQGQQHGKRKEADVCRLRGIHAYHVHDRWQVTGKFSAGGAYPHSTTWSRNPQYSLRCLSNKATRVLVVLRPHTNKGAASQRRESDAYGSLLVVKSTRFGQRKYELEADDIVANSLKQQTHLNPAEVFCEFGVAADSGHSTPTTPARKPPAAVASPVAALASLHSASSLSSLTSQELEELARKEEEEAEEEKERCFIIIPSTFKAKQPNSFELFLWADHPIEVTPARTRSGLFSAKVHGAWDPNAGTSGGICPQYVSWRRNPQFVVDWDAPGRAKPVPEAHFVVITLKQHRINSRSIRLNDKPPLPADPNEVQSKRIGMGFLVVKQDRTSKRVMVVANKDIVHVSSFKMQREIVSEVTLPALPEHMRYVIIPCSYRPKDAATFSLELKSELSYARLLPCPTLQDLFTYRHTVGEWSKTTAGGAFPTEETWRKNPQYILKINQSQGTQVPVTIVLSQHKANSASSGGGDLDVSTITEAHIGFYIVKAPSVCVHKRQDIAVSDVVGMSGFKRAPEMAVTSVLESGQNYVILPCTRRPGMLAPFRVHVHAPAGAQVALGELSAGAAKTQQEVSLMGTWSGMSAGGCFPNHSTWRHCPQFSVLVKAGQSGTLRFTLSQHNSVAADSTPTLHGIGMILCHGHEHGRGPHLHRLMDLTATQVKMKSPFARRQQVSCSLDIVSRDEDTRYVIVPSTFAPKKEGKFELRCESRGLTCEFCELPPISAYLRRTMAGCWKGPTSGGCYPNNKTWNKGPQYSVTIIPKSSGQGNHEEKEKETEDCALTFTLTVVLSQRTEPTNGMVAMGFYVLKDRLVRGLPGAPNKGQLSRVQRIVPAHVVHVSRFARTAEIAVTLRGRVMLTTSSNTAVNEPKRPRPPPKPHSRPPSIARPPPPPPKAAKPSSSSSSSVGSAATTNSVGRGSTGSRLPAMMRQASAPVEPSGRVIRPPPGGSRAGKAPPPFPPSAAAAHAPSRGKDNGVDMEWRVTASDAARGLSLSLLPFTLRAGDENDFAVDVYAPSTHVQDLQLTSLPPQ